MGRPGCKPKRRHENTPGLDELSYEYDILNGSPRKVRRVGELDDAARGASSGRRARSSPETPSDSPSSDGRRWKRALTSETSLSSSARDSLVESDLLTGDNQNLNGEVDLPERYQVLSHVKSAPLVYPRSAYERWHSLLPTVSEHEVLDDLDQTFERMQNQAEESPEYKYIFLDDFSIYRTPRDARRPNELAGLEKLQVHRGAADGLLFDGVLSLGETRHFVQGVPFRILTVDGYGDEDVASLSESICIQSPAAKQRDFWYQLGRPAPEYARFYEPFVWLAEFTKHFVDYLLEMSKVTLDDFRFCFNDWLTQRHSGKPGYRRWVSRSGLADFRTTVNAHLPYLWNECSGIDASLLKHPLWGEVDPYNLTAIPCRESHEHRTVVTPFAHDMFKRMYFGDFLREQAASANHGLERNIGKAKRKLRLAPFRRRQAQDVAPPTPQSNRSRSPMLRQSLGAGDVVTMQADTEGSWKTRSKTWYAYVQAVRTQESAKTVLDVLWLYEPHDTTLGQAYYPFQNELFLSDNCECGKQAVDKDHVTGKVHVSWSVTNPSLETGLFVRQKFRTVEEEGTHDFVSIKPSDFRCRCNTQTTDFEDVRRKYQIGDTVLVRMSRHPFKHDSLGPAQIIDFDLLAGRVVLRELGRVSDKDKSAPPNQLFATDTIFTRPANRIIRRCYVQSLGKSDILTGVPIGYDRGGAGDLYFTVRDSNTSASATNERFQTPEGLTLPSFNDGPDLMAAPVSEKLTGMGIFCGGGNFDRGLEDSGCVEFKYAVDWAERALHSYRANAPAPDKVNFFLGSVNDYLAQALKGSQASYIARPGGIDVLTAGSPCPGFSSLQPNKQSPESLQNASMVASVVSFVDTFCPKYCILENVVTMTAPMGGMKDQNVFAQVLAAFVAMGYQTQQVLGDSWSYGSSQSRSRVFVIASALGLQPFPLPQHTHDHPEAATVSLRGLGVASNGKKFGLRRDDYTPFPAMSAAEATKDLPDLHDGQVRVCPKFPDHVMPSEQGSRGRECIAAVPVRPRGMGLTQAVHQGLVFGSPRDFVQRCSSVRAMKNSKIYSRIRPDRLFPTVTTALRLSCGITGNTLHWDEHRSLTVMELRRAQGFLDHEVIVGSPGQQVEIIGNSVDRKVAFTLGMGMRESWLASIRQVDETDAEFDDMLQSPPTTDAERESTNADLVHEDSELGESAEEEDGVAGQADSLVAWQDELRAGTAAVAGLEPVERAALQTFDTAAISSPLRTATRSGFQVIDLTMSDEEEDQLEVEAVKTRDGEPGSWLQRASRPTAYVEIQREQGK